VEDGVVAGRGGGRGGLGEVEFQETVLGGLGHDEVLLLLVALQPGGVGQRAEGQA